MNNDMDRGKERKENQSPEMQSAIAVVHSPVAADSTSIR